MARPGLRLWFRKRQTAQLKQDLLQSEGSFDDRPVDKPGEDHLNVDHLVNALAGLIARQHTSLTIGVYGEWGSGKTSFLKLLMTCLRQDGIYPIWFDAWKYNKKENLWSALIQTILNQSGKEGGFFRRLWVKWRLWLFRMNFKAGSWDITKNAAALLLRILLIVAFIFACINSPQIATWLKNHLIPSSIISPGFLTGLVVVFTVLSTIVAADPAKLWDLFKDDIHFDFSKFEAQLSYRDHIAFLDEFSEQFQRLIGLVRQRHKPLVIIIDDLDRCLPENALQVLEAIKVLLDNASCIFLLGVDIERLQLQLQEMHRRRFDGDYFDKIIQQAVSIPRLSQEKKPIENFIKQLNTPSGCIFEPESRSVDPEDNILDPDVAVPIPDKAIIDRHVELCAAIFALGLPPNPRKIKRTVRSFRFARDMILERIKEDARKPVDEVNKIRKGDILATLLAKMTVIREQYKPFYEEIINAPSLLKQLESSYRDFEQNWSQIARDHANLFDSLPKILSEKIDEADSFSEVEDVHLYIEQIGTLAERGHILDKLAAGSQIPLSHDSQAPRQIAVQAPDHTTSGQLPQVPPVLAGAGAGETKQQAAPPEPSTIISTQDQVLLRYLPVERNPLFTAREDLLLQLQAAFLSQYRNARTSAWVALCGLGGIGKTQIAVEFAYRYQSNYSAIFWVSAETSDRLIADYIAIAERIYGPEYFIQDQEQIIEAVKHWFATHADWLLIFDGVTDLKAVRSFIPPVSRGNILLTTRQQLEEPDITCIDVNPFQTDDGILLLLRVAGIIRADSLLTKAPLADRRTAREIVQALDGLPLALDQAGAYIRETGCTLIEYLKQCQENSEELLNRRGSSPSHPEPVATTLLLSFRYVEEDSRAAAELLQLCAFLAGNAIPDEMLAQDEVDLGPTLNQALRTEASLDDLIEKLVRFSMIHHNRENRTLSLHRLVQRVLREKEDRATQRRWAERAIALVNHAFPLEVKPETWATCNRYLLQALECADLVDQWRPDLDSLAAAQLLDHAGRYLRVRALFNRAEQLLLKANLIYEQQLRREHPDVAANLNEIALIYLAQGRYAEAEQYLQRVLALYTRLSGPQSLEVAACLNNLAGVYDGLGQYEKALPLFERALHIREQALDPHHPLVAIILSNLAGLHFKQGNFQQAIAFYQRALNIYKQAPGDYRLNVASGLYNLAVVYAQIDNHEEASDYFKLALAAYEEVVGKDSRRLIPILTAFASFLRQFYPQVPEMIRQAEEMEKRVRAIQELYEQ
jgi:tetratricopeptide (TPR) repeat protein/Cdc6-like AAA superfamily ATPase